MENRQARPAPVDSRAPVDWPALTEAARARPARWQAEGRVARLSASGAEIRGIEAEAALGDSVEIRTRDGARVAGEVAALAPGHCLLALDAAAGRVGLGDRALLSGPPRIAPDAGWLGRVVAPCGTPLDGRPLHPGGVARPLLRPPPPPGERRGLGARLASGLAVFDTLLPLVRGQRVGLFAGSGVGKTSLLGALTRGLEADVVVLGLIGERGRELRHFTESVLGPEGMARAVVVAATSDQPAIMRRRAGWAAMAVAEHFRDEGAHVLLLIDSVTRLAEAHREIALAAGEGSEMRGHPPSLAAMLAALCERAGPGTERPGQGDITALFSVLVAGSDMEEPVADTLRGLLDGHVVLDRAIAERGRFPAVDARVSVSRALPGAARPEEVALIARARAILALREEAELMLRAGLYMPGGDPALDEAVTLWPRLDAFLARTSGSVAEAFAELAACLEPGNAA